MSYIIVEYKPAGTFEREATNAELLERAKKGDRRALKALMKRKGLTWATLTRAQKIKVLGVLLGEEDL